MGKFKRLALTELGETTDGYDYRVKSAKGYETVKYSFKTPNYTYTVRGDRYGDDYVEIGFSVEERESLAGTTNEGEQFKVMATVLDISKEIWELRYEYFEAADLLKGFLYSGYHKPDEDFDEISQRDKFYRRFIKTQYPSADISYDGAVTIVKIK